MRAKRSAFIVLLALSIGFFGSLAGISCAKQESEPVKGDVSQGAALFAANCARCHGEGAAGTDHGPPLVHKIYEPNHHADMAFQRAAANGVRAHHWKFGDMPPIETVGPADVEQIIGYVRSLQREAGIH